MRKFILAGMLVGMPIALYAQSGAPDVLSALLAEVRQLRIALEQAATTTPRIQLLASRLTVQNDRVGRAARELDGVRNELARMGGQSALAANRIQELESLAAAETDPTRRKLLAGEQREIKAQVEQMATVEQRLRAQESELANLYVIEQGAWNELNRRLDEVERELVRKPQ